MGTLGRWAVRLGTAVHSVVKWAVYCLAIALVGGTFVYVLIAEWLGLPTKRLLARVPVTVSPQLVGVGVLVVLVVVLADAEDTGVVRNELASRAEIGIGSSTTSRGDTGNDTSRSARSGSSPDRAPTGSTPDDDRDAGDDGSDDDVGVCDSDDDAGSDDHEGDDGSTPDTDTGADGEADDATVDAAETGVAEGEAGAFDETGAIADAVAGGAELEPAGERSETASDERRVAGDDVADERGVASDDVADERGGGAETVGASDPSDGTSPSERGRSVRLWQYALAVIVGVCVLALLYRSLRQR